VQARRLQPHSFCSSPAFGIGVTVLEKGLKKNVGKIFQVVLHTGTGRTLEEM